MEKIKLEDFEKAKQIIFDYYNQDFEEIHGKNRPCICCNKEIKPIHPNHIRFPESGMYDGGIVDKISAGYGSNHDTDMFIIAICDTCITELRENNKITYAGNYMNHY